MPRCRDTLRIHFVLDPRSTHWPDLAGLAEPDIDASDAAASFLVVVRADRPPVFACDIAIAQNALGLRANERHLPLWPQPGLLARAACRGVRLECLAYQGRIDRVPEWFRDGDLLAALRHFDSHLAVTNGFLPVK